MQLVSGVWITTGTDAGLGCPACLPPAIGCPLPAFDACEIIMSRRSRTRFARGKRGWEKAIPCTHAEVQKSRYMRLMRRSDSTGKNKMRTGGARGGRALSYIGTQAQSTRGWHACSHLSASQACGQVDKLTRWEPTWERELGAIGANGHGHGHVPFRTVPRRTVPYGETTSQLASQNTQTE